MHSTEADVCQIPRSKKSGRDVNVVSHRAGPEGAGAGRRWWWVEPGAAV